MVDELHMVESKNKISVKHEAPEFLESDYNKCLRVLERNIIRDETKKMEWRKRALEYESSYLIENRAKMIYIHDIEVNNIAVSYAINIISSSAMTRLV